MSLESLLKPLQWADEQVLRYYTKKTEEWEEKGRSKYSLAHIFNLSGTAANMSFMLQGDLYFVIGTGILALQSLDFGRNYVKERYESDASDGALTKTPVSYEITKKISSLARLPMLVTGIGLIVKGIAQVVDYIQTKNPESAMNGVYMCSFGYALIGTASSMYIKDSDPKLLEKKPLEYWIQQLELRPIPARERNKRI
ncbi:MAG: hypothetical protein AABX31_04345 [Nanoarchaeota archaeon]